MKKFKRKSKEKKKFSNLKKLENIFFLIKGKKFSKKNKIFEDLDSIQILDFISEIEKRFKIKFKASSINEKNFISLSSILKLINE
jgi:hypothetical protein